MESFLTILAGSATFVILRMMRKNDETKKRITRFDDRRFVWHNGEPLKWSIVDANDQTTTLTISPTPGRDFWSRTFYSPLLIKHDAQTLLAPTDADQELSVTTAFTLRPKSQFDQAGIMVYVDDNCWVKAGVEFTDGKPRLSCVVTNNGYSDWSTQVWPFDDDDHEKDERAVSIRVRVSKLLPGPMQGPSFVMEASKYLEGDTADSNMDNFFQVRIASLRSGNKPWKIGVFAVCPIANKNCSVCFHHIKFGDPVSIHEPAL